MTLSIPLFAQDQQYPAWMLRRELLARTGPGIGTSGTDFRVTAGAGLQVQVSAGDAYVAQTVASQEVVADEGLYYVHNDAPVNPTNTILAPVSNPRWDAVVLRVYDISEQALSGSSKAQIEWVQGTESAGAAITNLTGAPGSLPANSLLLAYVLQTVAESSIAAANILNVAATTGGNVISTITTQSTTSAAYTSLGDQIPGIVMPTNGLIAVWYQAIWSVAGAVVGFAGLFLGANQVTVGGPANTQVPVECSMSGSVNDSHLSSANSGLATGGNTGANSTDVTTGQLVGNSGSSGGVTGTNINGGYGPCYIFAAAGIYNVGVQFKVAAGGTVTTKNRKLWVQPLPFG